MPLIALLDPNKSSIVSEAVAMIIANCSDSASQQVLFARTGAIGKLAKLLSCPFAKTREAALDALAAVCRENEALGREVARALVEGKINVVQALLQFVKDSRPLTRLLACTCLTNLHKTNALASESLASSSASNLPQFILPTLVKLLQEKGAVKVRAPLVLAYLVSDSETLQKAASDSDAISKLASMLISSSLLPSATVSSPSDSELGSAVNTNKSMASFQDQLKEVRRRLPPHLMDCPFLMLLIECSIGPGSHLQSQGRVPKTGHLYQDPSPHCQCLGKR